MDRAGRSARAPRYASCPRSEERCVREGYGDRHQRWQPGSGTVQTPCIVDIVAGPHLGARANAGCYVAAVDYAIWALTGAVQARWTSYRNGAPVPYVIPGAGEGDGGGEEGEGYGYGYEEEYDGAAAEEP